MHRSDGTVSSEDDGQVLSCVCSNGVSATAAADGGSALPSAKGGPIVVNATGGTPSRAASYSCCKLDDTPSPPGASKSAAKGKYQQDTELASRVRGRRDFGKDGSVDVVVCKSCSSRLKNRFHLEQHMKDVHKVSKKSRTHVYTCEVCGAEFGQRQAYTTHMNRSHVSMSW